MKKFATGRIVIFEPDEEELKKTLVGRELSPSLDAFLKMLLKRKKWARKINIPSGRDDVAVVLVSPSTQRRRATNFSELHIFFAGKVFVKKWQLVGERSFIAASRRKSSAPSVSVRIRVEGTLVSVEFSVPSIGGRSAETLVKAFDFSGEVPRVEIIPDPLIREEPGDSPLL